MLCELNYHLPWVYEIPCFNRYSQIWCRVRCCHFHCKHGPNLAVLEASLSGNLWEQHFFGWHRRPNSMAPYMAVKGQEADQGPGRLSIVPRHHWAKLCRSTVHGNAEDISVVGDRYNSSHGQWVYMDLTQKAGVPPLGLWESSAACSPFMLDFCGIPTFKPKFLNSYPVRQQILA